MIGADEVEIREIGEIRENAVQPSRLWSDDGPSSGRDSDPEGGGLTPTPGGGAHRSPAAVIAVHES